MVKLLKFIINIIWILDVIDIPQLEFLDTTIPINDLAWFLYFIFCYDND